MSNTREDSNSGQRSVARQKAHKGNFRHKANENTVWTLVIIVLFYNSAFISANNPQKYPGKKIPQNSAFWGIKFTSCNFIDIRVVQSISYIIL